MTKNKIAKYVANTALLTVLAAAGIGAYQLGTAPVKEEKVREEAGMDEDTSASDNGENSGDTAGSADEESLVDVDTSQVEADMEGTSEDEIAEEESDGGSSQELTDGADAGEEGWEASAGADAEDSNLNTNFGTDAENNSQEASTGITTEEDGQEASAGTAAGDDDLAANAGIDAEKERRGMSAGTSASDTDSSTQGSTSESGAGAKKNSDSLETANTGVYADAAGGASNGLNPADSSSATASTSIATSGTNTNTAGAVNGTNTASLPKLSFSADTDMTWPVNGNILLDYNMDQTIYFPTLDQYKLNPAISVQAAEGAPVLASVPGTVYSIEENAQTGTTVTMEIGSGYQAIYGQLKDLEVAEGDTVAEGAVIGYIATPTKYYSSEGSNLYFAMKENGEPVDPIAYLP